MTDERNEARAKAAELETVVLQMGYTDKARRHFAEKGVDDPDWAAEIALPVMLSAEVEAENIGTYLDDKFARLFPEGAAPEPVAEVPTPDAIETPSFARPTPASDGQPAAKKVYTTSDPEIKALIQANDLATIERMEKAGELVLRTTAPVSPG